MNELSIRDAHKVEDSLRLIVGMNAKNIELVGKIREVLIECGQHEQAMTLCEAVTAMASATIYINSVIFSGVKIGGDK